MAEPRFKVGDRVAYPNIVMRDDDSAGHTDHTGLVTNVHTPAGKRVFYRIAPDDRERPPFCAGESMLHPADD